MRSTYLGVSNNVQTFPRHRALGWRKAKELRHVVGTISSSSSSFLCLAVSVAASAVTVTVMDIAGFVLSVSS